MAPLTASPAGVAPSETCSGRALAGAASQSPITEPGPVPGFLRVARLSEAQAPAVGLFVVLASAILGGVLRLLQPRQRPHRGRNRAKTAVLSNWE